MSRIRALQTTWSHSEPLLPEGLISLLHAMMRPARFALCMTGVRQVIIAIDGPAASGKSTIAKKLAGRLGAHYLDTGAMYRTVALAALRRGVPLTDENAVAELARRSRIEFLHESGTPTPRAVLLDGEDVTFEIRTPAVDDAVSAVAGMPGVRAAMVPQQRAVAATGHLLVVEGRDIGTVVFPDAEIKVFLTASASERARRRHSEMETRGHVIAEEEVRIGIARRDGADSSRESAPLTPADDAHELDTTELSIDQVVDRIVALAEGRS